ncbi:hypothetical protein [Burkholderia gladioli]|uniref:defense against restriction DarA-related protein n=1 Tax=Burkholderia gladioli TaxID=28095 RepID=UPI00163DFB14|nr:hypothetical protein [Burkholderia gladioli]
MTTFDRIEAAAHEGAYGHNNLPEPSQAMQDAGNYRKGRTAVRGIPIVIENPRGSMRSWRAADGTSGANLMKFHYGYVQGVTGADGDELDAFVGPFPEAEKAYVVNQNVRGAFDEHKVMLGFPDQRTAEAGYLSNFTIGWPGLASCVPCSIEQLRWWMTNGDLSKPLTADQLPYEATMDMKKVLWDSAGNPRDRTLGQLLYDIRRHDGRDQLIYDPLSLSDIYEASDGAVVLDGLVIPYNRIQQRMAIFQKSLNRAVEGLGVTALQVTEPFAQRGTTNVAAVFELTDGQTLAIFFHNPDATPKKIMPTDDLISWKWMLNKKDVTIAVAPERGVDLNVRTVAMRVMRLAQKNSARFATANATRAQRMASIDGMKQEIEQKEAVLDDLNEQILALEDQIATQTKAPAAPAAAPAPPEQAAAADAAEPEKQDPAPPVADPAAPIPVPPIEPDQPTTSEPAPAVAASPEQEPSFNLVSPEQQAELDLRAAALREELATLSDDELALVASTSPLSIPRAGAKDRDELIDRILREHPDDIAAALARWRELSAAPAEEPATTAEADAATAASTTAAEPVAAPVDAAPDLSYRASDDMFTMFYANTPAGEEAWRELAAQTEGTGKVLTQHVDDTVRQLREAGYTVEAGTLPTESADELLAQLDEPVSTPDPAVTPVPITDPTTPELYAQIMADPALQVQWQDQLDAFFQGRIVAVRNALRELGWDGPTGSDLAKTVDGTTYVAQMKFQHVGAGRNVVGYYTKIMDGSDIQAEVGDSLTLSPEGVAANIDAVFNSGTPAQPDAPVATDAPPAVADPEGAVVPHKAVADTDADYLSAIIGGTADLADASVPVELARIYQARGGETAVADLFRQAAAAYKQYALARARAALEQV